MVNNSWKYSNHMVISFWIILFRFIFMTKQKEKLKNSQSIYNSLTFLKKLIQLKRDVEVESLSNTNKAWRV